MPKAIDLKIGDIVSYTGNRFPFGDMEVVDKDAEGITCHRPFLKYDTKQVAIESLWWPLNSSFEFDIQTR
jgi:hypothetical protein